MIRTKVVYIALIAWSILTMFTSFIGMGYAIGSSTGGYVALLLKYIIVLIILLGLLRNKVGLTRGKLSKSIFIWAVYAFTISSIFMVGEWQKVYVELLWWVFLYFFFSEVAYRDRNNAEMTQFIYKYLPVLFIGNLVIYLLGWFSTNLLIGFASVSLNHYYYVGLLMPFLFLIEKRGLKYTLFILGFAAALISYKRSAIIFVFVLLVLLVYNDFIKSTSRRNVASLKSNSRMKGVVTGFWGILIFVGIIFYSYNKVNSLTGGYISQRFEQAEEDGGSGRTIIYESAIKQYMSLPISNMMVGIGFDGVRNHFNINEGIDEEHNASAHNDFLEMLCDFGLIGLSLYSVVIINLIRMTKRSKRISKTLYEANVAGLVVFFIMSMVSHLFLYGTYFGYLAILWGLSNGKQRRLGIA